MSIEAKTTAQARASARACLKKCGLGAWIKRAGMKEGGQAVPGILDLDDGEMLALANAYMILAVDLAEDGDESRESVLNEAVELARLTLRRS